MKHITTEDALRALEEAVAEKGEDFVYERVENGHGFLTCQYVVGGAPSCIAAHALVRLGVPVGDLASLEGQTPSGLADAGVIDADAEAIKVLDQAQSAQDAGETWGAALATARWVVTL